MKKVSVDGVIELLREINDNIDYRNTAELVDGGFLSSLDVVMILASVEEEYDVTIPAKDIIPENFNSATALCALVESLQE